MANVLLLFLQCSFQRGSVDSEVSGSAQLHILHQIDLCKDIQQCAVMFQRILLPFFCCICRVYGQRIKRPYLGFLGEKNEKLLILFNVENEVRDGFSLTKNFSLEINHI